MAEPLAIVPSLDEIAGDPSKARGLPASVVVDLLVRLDHVRAELHGEALRLSGQGQRRRCSTNSADAEHHTQ